MPWRLNFRRRQRLLWKFRAAAQRTQSQDRLALGQRCRYQNFRLRRRLQGRACRFPGAPAPHQLAMLARPSDLDSSSRYGGWRLRTWVEQRPRCPTYWRALRAAALSRFSRRPFPLRHRIKPGYRGSGALRQQDPRGLLSRSRGSLTFLRQACRRCRCHILRRSHKVSWRTQRGWVSVAALRGLKQGNLRRTSLARCASE